MDLFGSLDIMGSGAKSYSVPSDPPTSAQPGPEDFFQVPERGEQRDLNPGPQAEESGEPSVRVTASERAAVHKFIRESKSQLDLDINELQLAFSQMGLSANQRPSDHHIDQLVENLSLDEQKIPEARKIFSELFDATPGRPIRDYLGDGAGGLGIVSMMQMERRQGQLNQSLEDLSQKFFVEKKLQSGAQAAKTKEIGELPKFAEPTEPTEPIEPRQDLLETAKLPLKGIHLEEDSLRNERAQDPQWGPSRQPTEKTMAAGLKSSEVPSSGDGFDISTLVEMNGDEKVSDLEVNIKNMVASQHPVDQTPSQMEAKRPQGGVASTEGTLMTGGVTPQVDSQLQTSSTASPVRGPEMLMSAVRVADSEGQSNVNEILNQAQFLARRGGGEVKVILHPEGLGEVNLRVHSKDGQISVEMLTQSAEAKRVLENGLGDLRASLAAQKIGVDQIKVENTGEAAKDFNNPQEQQQRQSAQNFMEQFRQENQAFRRGFLDMPGIRAYRSQIQDPADNEDMIAAIQGDRKRAMAKRLDLVA